MTRCAECHKPINTMEYMCEGCLSKASEESKILGSSRRKSASKWAPEVQQLVAEQNDPEDLTKYVVLLFVGMLISEVVVSINYFHDSLAIPIMYAYGITAFSLWASLTYFPLRIITGRLTRTLITCIFFTVFAGTPGYILGSVLDSPSLNQLSQSLIRLIVPTVVIPDSGWPFAFAFGVCGLVFGLSFEFRDVLAILKERKQTFSNGTGNRV